MNLFKTLSNYLQIYELYCCLADCEGAHHVKDWPPVQPGFVHLTDSRHITIEKEGVPECLNASLAYLWRQTPIEKPIWGAPIYSDDFFRVPSHPWQWL